MLSVRIKSNNESYKIREEGKNCVCLMYIINIHIIHKRINEEKLNIKCNI